jgi:hypothetical protein
MGHFFFSRAIREARRCMLTKAAPMLHMSWGDPFSKPSAVPSPFSVPAFRRGRPGVLWDYDASPRGRSLQPRPCTDQLYRHRECAIPVRLLYTPFCRPRTPPPTRSWAVHCLYSIFVRESRRPWRQSGRTDGCRWRKNLQVSRQSKTHADYYDDNRGVSDDGRGNRSEVLLPADVPGSCRRSVRRSGEIKRNYSLEVLYGRHRTRVSTIRKCAFESAEPVGTNRHLRENRSAGGWSGLDANVEVHPLYIDYFV